MDETARGYSKEHAEYYDVQVTSRERGDEDFYVERAREADGPVLEMACGTGRIYLELLRAGIDADGFDLSAGALSILRENALAEGLSPTVWSADMADFTVEREYDLVICPVNSLQNLLTIESQQSALQSVYDALIPGGTFVFDVFVPGFDLICDTYGEWQIATETYRGASHEVRTRSRIVDEVEQQFTAEMEVYDPDGERVFSEAHRLKMFPKREVELLARLSPFTEWQVTGGFTRSPLTDGDSTQMWTLEK